MIWLTEEDRELLKEMEAEISKEEMQINWEAFMELTPIHSGSEEEEDAFRFLKAKLEEYGLEPEMLRYDAYISDPKYAKLEILLPLEMELKCTPYRQVGSTGPEGIEGEVIYIAPEDIGRAACRDKIVLCEQQTAGDWMGLRAGLLLRLQEQGIKGLIVIEQDRLQARCSPPARRLQRLREPHQRQHRQDPDHPRHRPPHKQGRRLHPRAREAGRGQSPGHLGRRDGVEGRGASSRRDQRRSGAR